jgi:hypothetical protein
MPKWIVSRLGVLMLVNFACASSPAPTDTVANALASMRGAEELGAPGVPRAALQLQLAHEQLERAKRLMADGKHSRAHNMALRAGHDAELAIALTREAQARKAAEEAKRRVDAAQTPEVNP